MKKKMFNKVIIYLIPIFILATISLLNLYYAPNISSLYNNFFSKQVIWYSLGFIIFIAILLIKPKLLLKYSFYLYIFNVFLLLAVLFLGKEINGSKAWFSLGFFSFQPSEFMKLSLILYLTHLSSTTILKTNKDHLILLGKIIIVFLIPSILTFLEPDTGAIIIYFFITLGIILASKIKKKYIFLIGGIVLFIASIFIVLFYTKQDLFIKIFSSKIYYRIDRLTNFKNGSGLQIDNALITIGSANFFTLPTHAKNLYFPEALTDFIFALTINNFGIFGGIIVLACYLFLDIIIVYQIFNVKNNESRLLSFSFLFMFLYHQIQNIFMNIGLMPIVGIPLPFLSYGGSSLILFFISLAIIIKLSLEKEKYPFRVFYR